MTQEPTHKVRINKLQLLAIQYADDTTTDEEIRQNDITTIYYDEKQQMLEHGELINAQIRGLPGSGKSTLMLAEVLHTNQLLNKKTTMDHILPNQIVWIQVVRRIQQEQHICVGIDEIDDLGDTGYNATIDQASLNSYSDLGRAHYIHRYTCSPRDTLEKNAFLILDVLGADKERQYTRCLLHYKLLKGGMEREQLIGYIDINVRDILQTKLYKEYHQRKMQRLQLFSQYGIIHERHIFFAKVLLHAYHELRPLAQLNKIEKGIVELQIDISSRHHKQINSILGTNKFTQDLTSILQYVTYQEKERAILKKLKQQAKTGQDVTKQIEQHGMILHKLETQEQHILEYWNNASKLEQYYISNLGKQ